MKVSRKSFLAVFAVVASSSALVFSLQASGASSDHHGGKPHGKLFSSSLVGIVLTDPTIHAVPRAGAAWNLKRGTARLDRNGKFELEVKGLLLLDGTTGPVTTISASFFCAPDSNATPAFTTGQVPLSTHGDARIREHVTVPSRCLSPVVLVHPNGGTTRYIAASGFTS
jgi:hypothetical protein